MGSDGDDDDQVTVVVLQGGVPRQPGPGRHHTVQQRGPVRPPAGGLPAPAPGHRTGQCSPWPPPADPWLLQEVVEVTVESLNTTAGAQLVVATHPLPYYNDVVWTVLVDTGTVQVGGGDSGGQCTVEQRLY